MKLTAVYMKVPEGYVAFVEGLPGANTEGETLGEARANLEEAVAMVLDANRELSERSLRGADVIRETLPFRRRETRRSHSVDRAAGLRVVPLPTIEEGAFVSSPNPYFGPSKSWNPTYAIQLGWPFTAVMV
jgi:predicted RNase H-like HicB family nuclease